MLHHDPANNDIGNLIRFERLDISHSQVPKTPGSFADGAVPVVRRLCRICARPVIVVSQGGQQLYRHGRIQGPQRCWQEEAA